MSSEEGNCCAPQQRAEVIQAQKVEDSEFDCNSVLSQLKRENEEMYQSLQELPDLNFNGDDASPPYSIKKEPEDSERDFEILAENNMVLKEEVDIEEHKPGWELLAGTRARNTGTFTDELDSAAGSKSEEQAKYNCTHCSYKAKDKSTFIRHFNCKHSTKAKGYKCEECSYQTRRKGDLTKHYNRKHSQEPAGVYKCEKCSFQTRYESDLTVHHKIKHSKDAEAEVYKCRYCSYENKNKSVLTRHFKYKHSTEAQDYKCAKCSFKTRYKHYLTVHYKNKHSNK